MLDLQAAVRRLCALTQTAQRLGQDCRELHDRHERAVARAREVRNQGVPAAPFPSLQQALDLERRRVKSMTEALILAQERERQQIGALLHDTLQQVLVAGKIRVDLLERDHGAAVRIRCDEIRAVLDNAIACARSLSGDLDSPVLRGKGLPAALEWLVAWMADTHQLRVEVQTTGTDAEWSCLDEGISVVLFQAIRELLFNVVKHARTAEAEVRVRWEPERLRIVVADRGAGFEPWRVPESSTGFGLRSLRERLRSVGAIVNVASSPGRGTRITLTLEHSIRSPL